MPSATMDFTDDETSALLRECDWVHRLARALVADPGAAADAARDTLVLALRRTPRAGAPLRPWLAGLLQNLLRQDRRSAQRQVAREARYTAAVGEREAEPSSQLERLELHRHVIALVQALDEPYRSTEDGLVAGQDHDATGVAAEWSRARVEHDVPDMSAPSDRSAASATTAVVDVVVRQVETGAPEERVVDTTSFSDGPFGAQSSAGAPEHEVILLRGVTIEGWVTNGGGRPSADATIRFEASDALAAGHSTSDDTGLYTLQSVQIVDHNP